MRDLTQSPVSTYLADYFALQDLRLDAMDPTGELFVADCRALGAGEWVESCLANDDGAVLLSQEMFDAKNAEMALANRFAEQFLVRRVKALAEEVLHAWDGSDLKDGVVVDRKYAASLPLQWRVKAYKLFKDEVIFSYANIYSFLYRRTTASSQRSTRSFSEKSV